MFFIKMFLNLFIITINIETILIFIAI